MQYLSKKMAWNGKPRYLTMEDAADAVNKFGFRFSCGVLAEVYEKSLWDKKVLDYSRFPEKLGPWDECMRCKLDCPVLPQLLR